MIAVQSLDEQREAWIARAVAHGMSEADARQTAARMASFAAPAPAKVPRKRAATAQPVADVLATRPRKARTGPHKAAQAVPAARSAAPALAASGGLSEPLATLPSFADDLRAIPNHLARSPLFAPVRPGRRELRQDELLPSPQGVQIHYTGPQLDQGDCDVFMQLIAEQRGRHVGEPVQIVRQTFLHSIGRQTGGSDYAWLQETLRRLQSAHVRIENDRYIMTAQLLGKVVEDKIDSTFHVVMDRDIVEMFAPSARSLVDWPKRMRIERRVDLAKWLQNFLSSHSDRQQFHSLENLRVWSGYSSPLRKFKDAAGEALAELERLEIIGEPAFYTRTNPETRKSELMVKWIRV